jgi:hypothetical protein
MCDWLDLHVGESLLSVKPKLIDHLMSNLSRSEAFLQARPERF